MGRIKFSTRDLTLMAMFVALTAILSQISIPLPFTPIPMNPALLSVLLAGSLLGPLRGSISQLVYVMVGAVGIPVFANFGGGLGVLAGPTGGYILGYLISPVIIGWIYRRHGKSLWVRIAGMSMGVIGCYTLGTLWFMLFTKTGAWAALTMCVLPFIPGDLIKIGVAAFLVKRLEPIFSFFI